MDKDRRMSKSSLRTIIGLGIVGTLAQLGWATMDFSALPVWINYEMRRGQELGLILATFMLTEALFRPPLGALSDRIGRKPLMLIGPLLGIFTSIITVHTGSMVVMVLLRAIDGIGLAAFWPAAFAAASDAVEEKSRSTAMAVLNSCSMAGIALGFPLGGLANDLTRSHSGSFYLVSAMFAVTFIVGLIVFPRELHKHEHHEHADGGLHRPDAEEVRSAIRTVPDMLALSVIVFAAIGLLMPIVKLYAMEQIGMSETKFGTMIFPIAAVLGVFAVPFGKLADKWGKLVSFCYGLVICTLSMWLVSVFRNMWVLAGAGAVLGVGFALAFPAWMAVVSQAAPPARRGQILGAVGMAQGIGAIIGSALGPVIYASDTVSLPHLGVMSRNLPFYLCAVLLSIGTVMAFTWISRLRGNQSNGRLITWQERRGVIAAGLIGLMVISGWVVYRHTRPLPAERVAWLWVQAVVHGDAEKAKRYTTPAFEEPNIEGKTASDISANTYHGWAEKKKAYYTPPSHPSISSDDQRAEVSVVFHFNDRTRAREIITLTKQPSGDWKVANRRSARP